MFLQQLISRFRYIASRPDYLQVEQGHLAKVPVLFFCLVRHKNKVPLGCQTMLLLLGAVWKSSVLSTRAPEGNAVVWSYATSANNKREIDALHALLPTDATQMLGTRSNVFVRVAASITMLLQAIGSRRVAQIYRVARHIVRSNPPLTALYKLWALVMYSQSLRLLSGAQKPRYLAVANDHSSDTLALVYAAKACGIKTIYTQHGMVNARFPPLVFDVSLLYNRASADAYRAHGELPGTVLYKGMPGDGKPLRPVPNGDLTIGLCLNNLPNREALHSLCDVLQPQAKLVIRPHPSAQESFDINRHNGVTIIPASNPITEFADACDFCVVNNTGAILELLQQGCPVLYVEALDELETDYFGFVAQGLIPSVPAAADVVIDDVRTFYAQPDWSEKFRYYDETAATPKAILDAAIAEAICS